MARYDYDHGYRGFVPPLPGSSWLAPEAWGWTGAGFPGTPFGWGMGPMQMPRYGGYDRGYRRPRRGYGYDTGYRRPPWGW